MDFSRQVSFKASLNAVCLTPFDRRHAYVPEIQSFERFFRSPKKRTWEGLPGKAALPGPPIHRRRLPAAAWLIYLYFLRCQPPQRTAGVRTCRVRQINRRSSWFPHSRPAAAGSPGSAPIPSLPFKQPCYRFFSCSADLLFPAGRSSHANLEGRWPAVLSGNLYAPSTDGLASVNFFPCTNMLYSDIQEHVSLGVFHDEPRFVVSGGAEMIYYLSCNTGAEIYVLPRHG